jgi:hypothetical protein
MALSQNKIQVNQYWTPVNYRREEYLWRPKELLQVVEHLQATTMVSKLPLIANSSRSQLRTLPESCATNFQSRVHRPLHLTAMLHLEQENANTIHTNDCADPEICKMDAKQPRRCGSPFHRLPNNQEWVFGPSPSCITSCSSPWAQE